GRHFSAEIAGHELSVAFGDSRSDIGHSVTLTVTAGDIFYTFRFAQAAPAGTEVKQDNNHKLVTK
ncbi:MAG: hypothetical protein K5945_04675, partial [Bacteroidaceae bacterium]|nr:hypothetical protein [Bacteroidaceae bacterium]